MMREKTPTCELKRTRRDPWPLMTHGKRDSMKCKVLIAAASGVLVISAPTTIASTLTLSLYDETAPTGSAAYSTTFAYAGGAGAWDVKATNAYVSDPPDGYTPGTAGDFDVGLTTMGSLINYGNGTWYMEMHLNVTNARGTGSSQFRAVLNASDLGLSGYYAVRSGIGGHDSTGSSATHSFTETVNGSSSTLATQYGPTYSVNNTRSPVGPAGSLTLNHDVLSSSIGVGQTVTYDTYSEIIALATGTVGDAYLGAIHQRDTFNSKFVDVAATSGNTQQLSISSSSGTGSASASDTNGISGVNAGVVVSDVVSVNIANAASRGKGAVSETVTVGFTSSGSAGTAATNSDGSIVTGDIYSGLSTWNIATGGSWGGNNQDKVGTHGLWSTYDGAPGVWGPDFDNVDTALFGTAIGSSTAEIKVNATGVPGEPISVKSITFENATGHYDIVSGTGSLQLKSDNGPAILNDLAGNHEITAPITMQSNVSSTVASGSVLTVNQLLTGTGGTQTLTKTGGGTLYFTGTGASSSNAAMTTVYQGTLRVDGTLNSPTLVTKDSGGAGTLTGVNGTIGGRVEIANGGTISPGNGEATRSSTLTVQSLLLDSGGNYHFDISAMSDPGYQPSAGTNYDTIASAGKLDLSGITTSDFNLQVDYPSTDGFNLHLGLPLGTRYIRARHRAPPKRHGRGFPV